MASTYGKLTLASFREALKGGRYKTATDARRSVGKASEFSDRDKAAARAEIDKHFGAAPAPAKRAKPAKAVTVAKAPRPAKQAARKRASARVREQDAPAKQMAAPGHVTFRPAPDLSNVDTQMRIASDTIQQVSQATNLVIQANEKGYMQDESAPFYSMVNRTLSSAVQVFDQIVKRVAPAPSTAAKAPAPKPKVEPAPAAADDEKDEASPRELLRNSRPDAASL